MGETQDLAREIDSFRHLSHKRLVRNAQKSTHRERLPEPKENQGGLYKRWQRRLKRFFFRPWIFPNASFFLVTLIPSMGRVWYTLRKIHDMVDVYGPETSFNGRLDFAGIFW